MYGQPFTLTVDNVFQFFYLSRYLEIPSIHKKAEQFISQHAHDELFLLSLIQQCDTVQEDHMVTQIAPLLEFAISSDSEPISLSADCFINLLVESLLQDSEICMWLVSSLSKSFLDKNWTAEELKIALAKIPITNCTMKYWHSEFIRPLTESVRDQDVLTIIQQFTFNSFIVFAESGHELSIAPTSVSNQTQLFKPKVLYITPEFPPQINGGLGEASFNISKSLCETTDLHLVIPQLPTESGVFETFTPKSIIYMDDVLVRGYYSYSPTCLSVSCVNLQAYRSVYGYPSVYQNVGSYTIDRTLQQQCIDTNFDVIHISDWLTVDSGIALKRKQENL
ncbi:hypothetical protein GEMRC1_006799 [Eukaryota sp. GEM-RC1]